MKNDLDNLSTNLRRLSYDINISYVNSTTFSILSNTIDGEFATTTAYIDDKIQKQQHEYRDQETENLRNEG